MSLSKKLLFVVYVIFVISSLVSVVTLSILGNKERIGYLEVVGKDEVKGTHKIRVRYYDKVFRSSDIYGVYVKEESMPEEFKTVIWDTKGSPFGDVVIANNLESGYKISDITYTLKVKKMLIVYLLFIIIALPLLYIAFSKSNMKIFSTTDEVLASVNRVSSIKNIYYILGIFAILFIFALLWYSKGYYAFYHPVDGPVESYGEIINFRFPQNLFEKVGHLNTKGYWYKTRWTGTVFIFLSAHIVSPIYTMITGDVVESIFVSQGVMISFIVISIGFILALYMMTIFSVKILSKYFLLLLFFVQSIIVAINSIAISSKELYYFIGLQYSISPISNYYGSLLLLLIALFPYWRYLISNKWDDWFDKKGLVAVYHLVIILTALSSPAITSFYGLVSGLIFINLLVKERAIPAINHKIASTLYASMFWTTIAMISESKYILGSVGGDVANKLNGLTSSLLIIVAYTLVFLLLTVLPLLAIKKHQKIKSDKLLKNISISILLCYIATLSHLLLASLKNSQTLKQLVNTGYGSAFNSSYICVANIFLILAITIIFISLFFYLRLSFIKGFMLMFLVSHFIFYISYVNKGEVLHLITYKFFKMIHEANKEKDINTNIVYIDNNEIFDKYRGEWGSKELINRVQIFAREFNIIDKDAVIMERTNEQ